MRALLWAAGLGALNLAFSGLAPLKPCGEPPRLGTREGAVLGVSLTALGMRRLAADIAFIRLMIYYGTPEHVDSEEAGHVHDELEYGSGVYAEFTPRSLDILGLDPHFTYAALYSASALAFNLDRAQEAVQVLETALRCDPKNWKLLAHLAAVGFHKKGDPERALSKIRPVLLQSDCPTMLKNMAAFMCVRLGRKEEARRLYEEILLSRDAGYRESARRALERLGAKIAW